MFCCLMWPLRNATGLDESGQVQKGKIDGVYSCRLSLGGLCWSWTGPRWTYIRLDEDKIDLKGLVYGVLGWI